MKSFILSIVMVAWAVGAETLDSIPGFDRPVPAPRWTEAALVRLRDAPAAPFATDIAAANAALSIPAAAPDRLDYEGRLAQDPVRLVTVEALADVSRVHACHIAWLRGKDRRHADRAVAGITAWALQYRITGNAINEHKLSALVAAWGSVRRFAVDPAAIDGWVRALAEAQVAAARRGGDTTRNNWQTKRLKLTALAGSALDDGELRRWSAEGLAAFCSGAIATTGESEDFRTRDSLGYHCGMLVPLLEIAAALGQPEAYRRRGAAGGSPADAVAFLLPYAKGEKTHAEWVRSTVELDRRRAASGDPHYRPGRLFAPAEAATALTIASAFQPKLAELAATLAGGGSADLLLLQARPWAP